MKSAKLKAYAQYIITYDSVLQYLCIISISVSNYLS